MGRRAGTARICVICGDKAKGINFNVASCCSCKAFFRRNGLQKKELSCPFTDNCKIDIITRRFCTKCRLKKCFDAGMKKEWILSDEERLKIKEKIRLNRLKKEEMEKSGLFGLNLDSTSSSEATATTTPPKLDITSLSTETISLSPLVTETESSFDMLASLMPTIFTPQQGQQQPPSEDSLELNSTLGDLCDELLLDNNRPQSSTSSFDVDYLRDLDLSNLNSPSSSTTDIIQSQTVSCFQPTSSSSKYESILEFVPNSAGILSNLSLLNTITPMYPQINCFPYQELILPESCLLQELTAACSVLQNPYKRIQYLESFNLEDASRITQFTFHRLIRASRGLNAFNQLTREDQGKMLKTSLLKMLSIRTVIMYNSNRECWGFINDNSQSNVMVPMKYIEPYCTKCGYQRHRNLPNLFRDEWKQDSIIFDLLTAIVLFTPQSDDYCDYNRVQSEHSRYTHLLYRYLTLKYPTITEAEECFRKLLNNIEEMFTLNDDILNFMRSFSEVFSKSTFYVQLLDLDLSLEKRKPEEEVEVEQQISEMPVENTSKSQNILGDLFWL